MNNTEKRQKRVEGGVNIGFGAVLLMIGALMVNAEADELLAAANFFIGGTFVASGAYKAITGKGTHKLLP